MEKQENNATIKWLDVKKEQRRGVKEFGKNYLVIVVKVKSMV